MPSQGSNVTIEINKAKTGKLTILQVFTYDACFKANQNFINLKYEYIKNSLF